MDERIKIYPEKMTKTYENMLDEFSTIRAGRANPGVLKRITVDYYGSQTPLNQVANVTVPEARIIQIQPWEASMLKKIEKAINMSDIGINPTNDGKVIRLIFPELTEERRKDLSKDIRKKGEAAKVATRNIRRDANDALKKNKELPEDEVKKQQDEIQKATDKAIAQIDSLLAEKEADILKV